MEKKKRTGRLSVSRKSLSLDHIMVPNTVFGLSKTPFHSFQRHGDDMLALSWSKSWMTQTSRDALMFAEALRKQLLSSSMDKQFKVSKKEAFNKGSWGKSASRCNHLLLGSNYLGQSHCFHSPETINRETLCLKARGKRYWN